MSNNESDNISKIFESGFKIFADIFTPDESEKENIKKIFNDRKNSRSNNDFHFSSTINTLEDKIISRKEQNDFIELIKKRPSVDIISNLLYNIENKNLTQTELSVLSNILLKKETI